MTASTPLPVTDRALLGRIWRDYLRPRWRGLATALVAAVLVAGLSAWLISLVRPAVDDLLVHPKPTALWGIPLSIAGLALLRGTLQIGQATLINRIGHGLVGDVQVQLFSRLIRADLARLRDVHSGGHVASVLYDAGLIREAATSGAINYVREALTVLGAMAVMVSSDPWLALGVLSAIPIVSAVLQRFSRRTRKAAEGAMAETSALSTAIMESLDGIRIVKIDNREADEEARVSAVVERRQAHIIKGANARAQAAPATETVMTLITAGVFAFAGWRAQAGGMTVGAFVAFIGALAMASQSLRQVVNLQTVMIEGLTAARRLFAALDIAPLVTERADAHELQPGEGRIALEAVSFSYGVRPVLSEVSLHAERGETIALVGPSGGGKSTIFSLIPRFYDVSAGRVVIDGVDVRDATLASLRDQIALVTQEPFLFDDTIAANIAYARPDVSSQSIETAARQAAAHDFIMALPMGYATLVGEAGARLSGGQRQRIAIARAFLKDAPFLLLDEATSALDADSEAQVQIALERLMSGRTTIVIAHRLATIRGADRIYVIENGAVVEVGKHAELIARPRGLYARLAKAQDLDGLAEAAG